MKSGNATLHFKFLRGHHFKKLELTAMNKLGKV